MHALRSKHRLVLRNVQGATNTTARSSPSARTSSKPGNAPCSPRLEKLEHLEPRSPATKDAMRLKEQRELAQVQHFETALQAARNQQEQQRSFLYHTRWLHLRGFYALMCETMATISTRPPASPLARGATAPSRQTPLPSEHQASTAITTAAPPATAVWLRDIANEFHRAFATPEIALPQLEIALNKALRVELFTMPAFTEVAARLKAVFQAFQRPETLKVDVRELLCALYVLDRWRAGEAKLLLLWFEEFATMPRGSTGLAVPTPDLQRLLFTACEGGADEKLLAPFAQDLANQSGSSHSGYVTERAFTEYVDTTPKLLEVVKAQCWRRLTDDMRLAFYRDLFVQASSKLEEERLRVRMEAALRLWRSHEPRRRIARWKLFVADRKLFRRSDVHFRTVGSRKVVAALSRQRVRQQQMRDMAAIARVKYCASLLLWTLQSWQLYVHSTQLLLKAAWRRSVVHHCRVWQQKTWRSLVKYYTDEKAHKAARQAKLEAFIASRHRKILRGSMGEWHYYYRRRKEVADAELRERELHHDLFEQSQIQAELAKMTLEDAISRAVELKTRDAIELARQRAFQDATQRVFANRKLKQQEDDRTHLKQEREAQARAEIAATWQSIQSKLQAEVRQSTLAWFATPEGTAAFRAEGARIFDQDPAVIQKALLQDASAFALPGCRWQLQLEDYGGRFAKPFYLNTETFEKIVCDELVLENCEEIAKEVLVQRRIDAAIVKMQGKAAALDQSRLEHAAALKIQGLFRGRHALLATRSLIRATFVKRIDPSSGGVVYFNTRRVETRRKPPRLIGSDERLIPVESSSWVRRTDDDGNTYYLRIDATSAPLSDAVLLDGDDSAQMETPPTWSWYPPPHYIMCARCKINFATRRCNETGARYCISCFADGVHSRRFPATSTWTKLPVQPATCVVCRNAPAARLCHECRGDVTCVRCFTAVHRNPKLAQHTEQDDLTHAAVA